MEESRARFERIRQRIAEFERTLDSLKQELLALECCESSGPPTEVPHRSRRHDTAGHRETYERLYSDFLNAGPEVVQRFVDGSEEEELITFCHENELTLGPSPFSKARIAVQIARHFAERRGRARREQ